jgi:two-component system, NarL family, response regulator DesR
MCPRTGGTQHQKGQDVIRTLIAEQTSLIRAGLVALLSGADDIEVVAELQRGDEVVPACKVLCPDVAVLAAALPGIDGFSASRALYADLPACHSLIIGERREPASARRAAAAKATGFIVRDTASDFLIEAIRRAARGRKVIDPDLAFAALSAQENPLTSRELDTLRLAAEGATTAEIATSLCLSLGTVRNYLSRAIAKIGARNRVDAIRIAARSGWF